jgi:DNA-binding NtrC family response regulator
VPQRLTSTVQIQLEGEPLCRLVLPRVRIRVEEGPDAGTWRSFDFASVRIGSAQDCDLVLTDPTVSGHHATVEVGQEATLLRDEGSTNGTFVKALKVLEAPVGDGLTCRLGSCLLRIEEVREEAQGRVASDQGALGALVGGSPAMREVYALLRAVGPSAASVLVTGETGTGKELAARTIHELSGRTGPLVVFDAATADPEMIRSDLFGHRKGAFTGAAGDRPGAFREAHRGTLFLDEIGELPLELQPRLLRALESRAVQPLGADRAEPVDVRVVAATHRDLVAMVARGEFREDLYHRLRVVEVRMPPLRDRAGDVPLLVEHLLAGFDAPLAWEPAARQAFEEHPWPGNVRAMRNALERLTILCRDRPVACGDFELPEAPVARGEDAPAPAPRRPDGRRVRAPAALEHERTLIEEALAQLKRRLKEPR